MGSVGLDALLEIARTAGEALLAMYGDALSVEYKGPGDPVTEADRRSNALLVSRLSEAFPGVPVVAEESEPAAFEHFRQAPHVFFVDPLDGTREFIDRNGEFAVMIGLVEPSRATEGVVYAPATRTAWVGSVGLGAWRIDATTGQRVSLRVSATDDLSRARIVVSRSHRTAALDEALLALGTPEVTVMGSAGLKGARVADGRADAYVDVGRGTKRWDACAIDALVTAAGGRVSDLSGAPIEYRARTLVNERGLVVSNGRTHASILARLAALASH